METEIINNNCVDEENKNIEKKKYDHKAYYKYLKENCQDKIKEKHTCKICYGRYTYFNKFIHKKTQKHQMALKLRAEGVISS